MYETRAKVKKGVKLSKRVSKKGLNVKHPNRNQPETGKAFENTTNQILGTKYYVIPT